MKTILFVCSGNTDRSPMAECLARDLIRRTGADIRAVSAGMAAASNLPASGGAIAEMERRGLSLKEHRSRPMTARLADEADLIVAVEERLSWFLDMHYPGCRVKCFRPAIADPSGGSPEDFRRAADAILAQLPGFLNQL